VNKADREGANDMVTALMSLLSHHPEDEEWQTPVLTAQAVNYIGIEELYQTIKNHRMSLEKTNRLEERRCEQRREELLKIIVENVSSRLNELMTGDKDFLSYLEKVEKGDMDAYSAYKEILNNKTLVKKWLA